MFDKLLFWHRKRVYNRIRKHLELNQNKTVLDIGSTADNGKASNIFLSFLENTSEVTSISDQLIPKEVKLRFPKTNFILSDALNLDFIDNEFDVVFSNATLEHVGSFDNQKKMIQEAIRVAKNNVIILTPNRWFPIETHTKLPLVHFLPKSIFRKIAKILGFQDLSKEENLNLISIKEVKQILSRLGTKNYKIDKLKFFCFTSNIAIIVYKSKSFEH